VKVKKGKSKPRRLTLPLSDAEILALKNGEEIRKCFHNGHWKGLAVVHADGFDHVREIERYEEARRDGHDVLNVPLGKDDLEQLYKGAIRCSYAKGKITLDVLSQQVHEQVLAELEAEKP
jgi:hypothetical protein